MKDFFLGVYYFFLGFKNLTQKGLKAFVILPIIFNLLIYIALAYIGYHYLSPIVHHYVSKLPEWLSFLSGFFTVLFFILFILFFLTTFSVLANICAAPFNGLLAERAQKLLMKDVIPERAFLSVVLQTIKRQGQFIRYYIPRLLLMCLLFFIPPLHPLLPFLWFLFNAWVLSIQYQDFAMDNNLIDFKAMRTIINHSKALSFGFGMTISSLSFIPFLNLIIMPAAVVGGVFLFYDNKHKSNYLSNLLSHSQKLKE
ncbi:sulfate transporter CysZ [Legionella hackeliae]|uniref:Sulfate transporter, CysZ-type n=1 Tax=Legionella hackeliae TaxID=449 RepID=A0A0A8UV70_LEGHA|nr:sulfate transporter CysZ [Legionella hackeliae]KTD09676.1 putative sulfate transport protein CysZ [Legionella hackeliae]CEK11007.1 Sulfate transporter, CysZ-type [Legionella hackeliae]STX47746.1 putative sulfate transport protein CysZ [Legionella hackeliae]